MGHHISDFSQMAISIDIHLSVVHSSFGIHIYYYLLLISMFDCQSCISALLVVSSYQYKPQANPYAMGISLKKNKIKKKENNALSTSAMTLCQFLTSISLLDAIDKRLHHFLSSGLRQSLKHLDDEHLDGQNDKSQ